MQAAECQIEIGIRFGIFFPSSPTVPEVLLSVPQREMEAGFSNSSMSIDNWKRKMDIEVIGGAST